MNTIEKLEKEQVAKLTEGKTIPDFSPGDTVRVDVRVSEGGRERLQAFEGVCIARTSRGINSSFTVRKISYGEGVERVFPLYSPVVEKITLVRRGKVKRAKLYYLRGLTGKAARISEKQDLRGTARAGRGEEAAEPKAAKPEAKPKQKTAKAGKAEKKPAAKAGKKPAGKTKNK